MSYEREFFGNAYPWFRGILLTLMLVFLLGNIAAYYLGMTDSINFASLGVLAVLIIVIAVVLRLLYKGISKLFK